MSIGRPDRIESIDLLRGVVMVIMALDHVRDFMSDRIFYDPVDLNTTTPGIFLTRWITHYCAPTFIFLAGTSAFLSGTRGKSRGELAWFLFTRGVWLALFEVTINRALWMFNFDVVHHGAGVFWAIGWAMVILSALVFLPPKVVGAIGVLAVASHNFLDGLTADDVHVPDLLWMILHRATPPDAQITGDYTFGTNYCLIPWAGVMAAGYGFGTIFTLKRPARRRWLFTIGTAVTVGFLIVRGLNIYGDPNPWKVQDRGPEWTVFSFLNCTKYPASLCYLLMTLGPSILALAIFDRPLGSLAKPIITFGRVPLFYYVLHIAMIHSLAVGIDYARFGWSPLVLAGPWDLNPKTCPPGYGLSLPMVYLVWVGVVLALYLPCRWYAGVKQRHPGGVLSYL
jgi:uncharacterized membrane protein